MTPVQAATLPQFLGNKDVVVEVGLLTFFIPSLHKYSILTQLAAL